jgi:hypothetical protein
MGKGAGRRELAAGRVERGGGIWLKMERRSRTGAEVIENRIG